MLWFLIVIRDILILDLKVLERYPVSSNYGIGR